MAIRKRYRALGLDLAGASIKSAKHKVNEDALSITARGAGLRCIVADEISQKFGDLKGGELVTKLVRIIENHDEDVAESIRVANQAIRELLTARDARGGVSVLAFDVEPNGKGGAMIDVCALGDIRIFHHAPRTISFNKALRSPVPMDIDDLGLMTCYAGAVEHPRINRATFKLEPGDTLVVGSDGGLHISGEELCGYLEAMNQCKLFGIYDVFKKICDEAMLDAVMDDRTLLLMRAL